jgi:D-alanyl-D-alanine carboxypeptidase
MRPNDTFRAGSIMKPFVATAVLQLVEEGKFSLDDRLPAVLPPDVVARVPDADLITVRMLLEHTSGVPEYDDRPFDLMVIANPRRVWKVEEFLDRSAAQPRRFAPGNRYAYSNTDYNLLGLVIEHATGKPWRVGYAPAQKLDLAMMINSGQAGDPLPVLMPALKLMVTAAS